MFELYFLMDHIWIHPNTLNPHHLLLLWAIYFRPRTGLAVNSIKLPDAKSSSLLLHFTQTWTPIKGRPVNAYEIHADLNGFPSGLSGKLARMPSLKAANLGPELKAILHIVGLSAGWETRLVLGIWLWNLTALSAPMYKRKSTGSCLGMLRRLNTDMRGSRQPRRLLQGKNESTWWSSLY